MDWWCNVITLKDYYMGRDKRFAAELTTELRRNASLLCRRLNILLMWFGEDRAITSGWRPPIINASVRGAAPKSRHMTCEAGDLEDADKKLGKWCLANVNVLEHLELWMEHPDATPTWCHFQLVPPGSGNRFFYP